MSEVNVAIDNWYKLFKSSVMRWKLVHVDFYKETQTIHLRN